MCGIFGAVGHLPDDVLARIDEVLHHRGPDGRGQFVDSDVVLLHRRLKIIDLSEAAAQPMSNEDGSVQVVFNGEIYNHRTLRAELERYGHRFRSRSDTEAIVHGYEQWGDDVVKKLDGMFAFGIWDRHRRRLLLARDRAGKKPLFYGSSGGIFRFGSTVASLHASGLEQRVAPDALPMYLAYGFVPPPRTLHAGVMQLPAASRLCLEAGRPARIDTYWQPRFGAEVTRENFLDASEHVRELVRAAVERRLESDVPLGAFLSGGIDSTIVVGLMTQITGSRVKTFSIGFSGDARYDETHYARIAARAFNTEHVEFTLDPSSFELVESLIRHHDGPFGDSSAIPTSVVAKLTRQRVTVALTGDGGDELFCGYHRFLAAEWAERVPRPVRLLAARSALLLPTAADQRSLASRARRLLLAGGLPLADRSARWVTFFDPRAILREDVAVELGHAVDAPLAWQREMFALGQGRSILSRVLEHNFRTYLPWDLLVKADRTSMAHSLETRSPFLDTALIEYAANLPPQFLRRGRETKRILKHAFRNLLPPEIRGRGKMGFSIPLDTWFRGNLRSYLRDHLLSSAALYSYLDRRYIENLLRDHLDGRCDHGQRLWLLLTLEIWLRSLAGRDFACAA